MNETTASPEQSCACGSGVDYSQCCGPIIAGLHPAPTAEALMRSRYTAYTKAAVSHVLETVSRKQRQHQDEQNVRTWALESEWLKLEVLASRNGGVSDNLGEVEFVAHYRVEGIDQRHHELAYFKREAGVWRYDGGKERSSVRTVTNPEKVGRNDPCPCGSGKKFKKCCGQ